MLRDSDDADDDDEDDEDGDDERVMVCFILQAPAMLTLRYESQRVHQHWDTCVTVFKIPQDVLILRPVRAET